MSCRHEWAGAVIKGPVNNIVIDQCESCGKLRLPDTAPPAQGIDLGQAIPPGMVMVQISDAERLCSIGESFGQHFDMLPVKRIRALIDGCSK